MVEKNTAVKATAYNLFSCVWEITLACCFSCKYCGSNAGSPRDNELTTEECLDVAEQLSDLGCRRVSLIGGEVFMRPDWDSVAKALTDRKIRVSIITNGYLFSEDLINKIKETGIESIAISLDGPETVHDLYRQKGSWKRALQAMDILICHEIPVSVISTLHSENVSHLDEMYEILKEKNIYAWQLQACSPMGNASTKDFSIEICFSDVIAFVEKHIEKSPFMIGIADNIGYYTKSERYLRGSVSGNTPFFGCRAGLNGIGIDSIGNVRGCESMYDDFFIEGNLRQRKLADIWNDPNAFYYNRAFTSELLSGKCKTCLFGNQCAGGCRSYNFFSNGGKMYESIHCAKQSDVN